MRENVFSGLLYLKVKYSVFSMFDIESELWVKIISFQPDTDVMVFNLTSNKNLKFKADIINK